MRSLRRCEARTPERRGVATWARQDVAKPRRGDVGTVPCRDRCPAGMWRSLGHQGVAKSARGEVATADVAARGRKTGALRREDARPGRCGARKRHRGVAAPGGECLAPRYPAPGRRDDGRRDDGRRDDGRRDDGRRGRETAASGPRYPRCRRWRSQDVGASGRLGSDAAMSVMTGRCGARTPGRWGVAEPGRRDGGALRSQDAGTVRRCEARAPGHR